MNISYWIASRLRLRGSGNRHGSATGVVIAVAGIALALIVMEFTLAIVVGFKDGIRGKLAGFESQIVISGAYDPASGTQASFIRMDSCIEDIIYSVLPDAKLTTALRVPGILKTGNDFEGIVFFGKDGRSETGFERSNMIRGEWPDFSADSTRNMIVLSATTAKALGLDTGDKVYSTFISESGDVKIRRNLIAGIFESGFGEYDRTTAYASSAALRGVCGVDSMTGTSVEISGLAEDGIDPLSALLQDRLVEAASDGVLDEIYPVGNVHQSGAMFYNWLSLLDTNVVVIFILMLCVAGFTLVSSLFILILERVKTIGILRAIGASRRTVRRIFMIMAMRIVVLGLFIGDIVGIGLLLAQRHFLIIRLDPEMYYLKYVPVAIEPLQILLLNVGTFIVAWLIMVLPAHFASDIDPARTMRYE